jgi:serine/threonine protein kinase
VHDFGIAANSRAYLVMELLRGMSLREALRAERRLEPKRAAAILTDLCAGVDAAHQRQLVHRDLKPENVFLTPVGQSERVKVLDFGIAKFLVGGDDMSTATGSGQIIGTLTYMGPEQLFGGVVEASWDLWAVGVIAYEMLTGRLPFAPTSGAAYHNAVIAGRFTPVSVHLPEAPPRLQEFFERAFSVEAAVRPHPAPHIAAEFERALE